MFKAFIAGVILTVALAVHFLGVIAVIVVAGIAFGMVLGEIVDALGTMSDGARKRGEGHSRVKSRDV